MSESSAGEDRLERALRDDLAAVHARAGAEIDDPVGVADRVLVVLDHDHGVAEIAQALEGFEQPVVVALVQADARLVEHVEHARQPAADLAGEADALALAAAQGAAGAVEVEVIEPDIVEEAQPLVDLLEDRLGDLALLRASCSERRNHLQRSRHRHAGDMRDVLAATFTHSASGLSRAPWQVSHGCAVWYLAQLLAHPRALGLEQAAVEVADHPFEGLFDGIALAPVDEGQRRPPCPRCRAGSPAAPRPAAPSTACRARSR